MALLGQIVAAAPNDATPRGCVWRALSRKSAPGRRQRKDAVARARGRRRPISATNALHQRRAEEADGLALSSAMCWRTAAEMWRPSLDALRLSLEESAKSPTCAAGSMNGYGKHDGFRVLDYSVDADTTGRRAPASSSFRESACSAPIFRRSVVLTPAPISRSLSAADKQRSCASKACSTAKGYMQ